MIKRMSRGDIQVQIGERTVTIEGEALAYSEGKTAFVIYKDSIQHWDAPNEGPIDELTKQEILRDVISELEQKGVRVEVE